MRKPLSKLETKSLINRIGIDKIRLELWTGAHPHYWLVIPQDGRRPQNLGRVQKSIRRWYKCTATDEPIFYQAINVRYFKLEPL
jgi:hypothetical protein